MLSQDLADEVGCGYRDFGRLGGFVSGGVRGGGFRFHPSDKKLSLGWGTDWSFLYLWFIPLFERRGLQIPLLLYGVGDVGAMNDVVVFIEVEDGDGVRSRR